MSDQVVVFDFDVTDDVIGLKFTLLELKACVEDKRRAIFDVDPEGPGSGWPNIKITVGSSDDAMRVRDWLVANHIPWSDEKGAVYDGHC